MVVEDNATVAEDCRESLEELGYSVTSISATGEASIANAERERPDAILMDIKLRGEMDGIEAAAQIHDRFEIPVVFLSAFSDRDLLRRARQTGSFGYLVKPFRQHELVATLEMAIYKAKAEKERRRLEARLQEGRKMEAIGRLAGGIAHDFNNMLSVMLGYTRMAMGKVDPAGSVYQDLQEVYAAAERSTDLVKQLLTFARKQIIEPKIIDLNEVVEKMMSLLRRLIGEEIDLVWAPAEKLWPVKMDPSQIDQILANLCVNAKDAISGVGTISIQTGMATFDPADGCGHEERHPGDFVLLTVRDDGKGMDKDILANLFEPFFTTKELGKGTGLGLSTIYGIVQQNSGFIDVHSAPDQGSIFDIYLPRFISETDEPPAVAASEQVVSDGHETVLLVEDEPTILKMVTMMLENQGYAVLSAATPEEAIRLMETHTGELDLLMTDVVMPGMNGRELSRHLMVHYPNLKCLFMSGYTADIVADHGVLEPGVHFIQKPFSPEDLATKIRQALDGDVGGST
jgi:signal transduction histidine kinase